MRDIRITIGKTVKGGRVQRVKAKWSVLVKKLTTFKEATVTLAEYKQLDQQDKADLKDAYGFVIGGYFKDRSRKKDQLVAKTLVTLDLDFLEPWDMEMILDVYKDYEFVAHSTMSHMNDAPKLRIVFPTDRDMHIDEYEAVARKVADWFSIDAVDKVSYRPAQLMYWPAHPSDCIPWSHHNKGEPLNVQAILDEYDDWRDFGSWPRAAKDAPPRPPSLKATDPLTKPGVVGAFCRCYNVHEAIREFALPYSPTEFEDRYTPAGSSGGAGAIAYDDGLFLYSHHSNDVASDALTNAYDLVRKCKFADADDKYDGDWAKAPSQQLMKEFAMTVPEVVEALADLEGLSALADDDESDAPRDKKKKKGKLKFKDISKLIAKLGDKATFEECQALIPRLAAAKLQPAELSTLAAMLKDRYPNPGPNRADVLANIKSVSKMLTAQVADDGGISDIEIDVIKAVLDEHYESGDHIRRVFGSFWHFHKGLWRRLPNDEVVGGKLLRTIVRFRTERPEDQLDLVAAVGDSKTSSLQGQLWRMFCSYLAERDDGPDPLGLLDELKPPVFNCKNGELWVDKKGGIDLRPHDPKNFFTSQIPVAWNASAKAPEWERFCDVIFDGDEEMRRHLEEICGYALQFRRNLKSWILFHGPTNAGKSTVGRVLTTMLGSAAASHPLGYYDGQNNHATAGLVGKLLLVDEDFDKGALLPDGFIKTISEEKRLTANPKNKDEFEFTCRALPLIISNHWPNTRDTTSALRNRAQVIPFATIPRKKRSDDRMEKMLRSEMPGILKLFVDGYRRLQVRGFWQPPKTCKKARHTWVQHSNPVHLFTEEMLVPDADGSVKSNDLFVAYKWWMRDSLPGGRMMGRNSFYEAVDSVLGSRRRDREDGFVWDGYTRSSKFVEDEF